MKEYKRIQMQRRRRKFRVRGKLSSRSGRPRLSVFRSHQHIYCQLIDDQSGKTICSASTRDKELADEVSYGGNVEAAKRVGQMIAERAQQAGVSECTFDRGLYKFHGRVAELANAAREAGLQF